MRKSPRILIVKLSSLGDLFHALPTVRALKKELNAKIDWVTQPEYESLVGFFDDVDRVICFPRHNFNKQIRNRCLGFGKTKTPKKSQIHNRIQTQLQHKRSLQQCVLHSH